MTPPPQVPFDVAAKLRSPPTRPTRIYTAAEAEDLLNGPLSRWERDLENAAPDLARSVVHWAVRADVAEAENARLRGLLAESIHPGRAG